MNAALAEITGYDRDTATPLNVSQLLDQESWQRSREQVLALLGGSGARKLELTAIGKDGQRIRMDVVRRLLFERGRAVAVQDTGHFLYHAAGQLPRQRGKVETDLALRSERGNRFAGHLKQLHRLSTTNYATLEEAFEDHLRTGCQLFDLPIGLLLQVDGGRGLIRASHGAPDLGATILLSPETPAHTIDARLRTVTASAQASLDSRSQPGFETYIGTPVWLGAELFATLSFSSPYTGSVRAFSAEDRELDRADGAEYRTRDSGAQNSIRARPAPEPGEKPQLRARDGGRESKHRGDPGGGRASSGRRAPGSAVLVTDSQGRGAGMGLRPQLSAG